MATPFQEAEQVHLQAIAINNRTSDDDVKALARVVSELARIVAFHVGTHDEVTAFLDDRPWDE